MKRIASITLTWLVLLAAVAHVSGQQQGLIPTPKFSDHVIPTNVVPQADSSIWQLVSVGIFVLALALATYLALVQRSRRMLLVLSIACVVWFGFVREGCVCSIGATQNVAQAVSDASFVVPTAVVVFFVLPLVVTLFFGRTFCAAVCPLGAIQEIAAVRSVRVPRWIDHALGLLPFMYLGAAVIFAATGTAYIICRYDPFIAIFRRGGNAGMLVFSGCFLVICLLVGRPYCRYLCPYGAILSLLSRVSKWHLRIVPGECINCRLCEEACPYGAIHAPTVPQSARWRALGKWLLGGALLAAPVIIGLFAWIGTRWSAPLSELHPRVQLAEQLRREEQGLAASATDETDAFRNTGESAEQLYEEALLLREKFASLGGWLGGWIGLVLGFKLVFLSLRRQRVDYHPQQAGCVSCGRCFKSCPVEMVRLGLIEDVAEVVKVEETPA